jgi:uncharacterized protein
MKYVLLYESADDVLSKAPGRWPAHSAHGQAFQELGSLIVHGPFGDPQAEGSMAVFTSRKAAEELAQGDPFVLNGVVRVGRSASGTRRSYRPRRAGLGSSLLPPCGPRPRRSYAALAPNGAPTALVLDPTETSARSGRTLGTTRSNDCPRRPRVSVCQHQR